MAVEEQHFTDPQHLSTLRDIAEALNEATDITEAMTAILPRLSGVLGLTTAWAFRYDHKRQTFVEVGASGLPPALAQDDARSLKSGWCECQDQFVEGKLHHAVNIVRCSRLRDAVGDKAGLVFHASVPLRSKGKPLGILNVASSGHNVFTNDALALLTAIGHQVAVAVDRAAILAAERERSKQLQSLSDIATELVSHIHQSDILQCAVERFVNQLGYECCGITIGPTEGNAASTSLIVAAHRMKPNTEAYTYENDEDDNDAVGTPVVSLIQTDAKSVLTHPIPQTDYVIRLESSHKNAFTDMDEDVVSVFAWHLAAALENAKLYNQSLQEAKWSERRQLAADLHDAVSQRLFSALLLSRTARILTSQSEAAETLATTLGKIESLIAESQSEMKGLIQALRPVDERGFIGALRERLSPLQLQSQTRIHLSVPEEEVQVRFEQREMLLMVVGEAIQNALKHAHAKNLYVRVATQHKKLNIRIQDDGNGFSVDTVEPGLGTATMYDRMQRIHGTVHIQSEPGVGTEVNIDLPVSWVIA